MPRLVFGEGCAWRAVGAVSVIPGMPVPVCVVDMFCESNEVATESQITRIKGFHGLGVAKRYTP